MGNAQAPPPDVTAQEMRGVLDLEVTLAHLVEKLQSDLRPHSIVLMVGAGLSVSAGIPDFRSPETGLYANLEKYKLPRPEAIFDIRYFEENPMPFYTLAKEMYPGTFHPTLGHFFIRLLQDKGLMRRCYTQNIDTLERQAGVSPELLVEAHGSFGAAHCVSCAEPYTQDWLRERISKNQVPVLCPKCQLGFVKPDIVFFGEPLPSRFRDLRGQDLDENTELLLIMGTSLSVQPFASLADAAHPLTPRLLMNREVVGLRGPGTNGHGLRLDCQDNYRDVALLGDLDASVWRLCDGLGWSAELVAVVKRYYVAVNAIGAEECVARVQKVAARDESALERCWRRAPVSLPRLREFGTAADEAGGAMIALAHSGWDAEKSEVCIRLDVTPAGGLSRLLRLAEDLVARRQGVLDASAAEARLCSTEEAMDTNGINGEVPAMEAHITCAGARSDCGDEESFSSAGRAQEVHEVDAERDAERVLEGKDDGDGDGDGDFEKSNEDDGSDNGGDDASRDRDWIGLFRRMDPAADAGGLGTVTDGVPGPGATAPDDASFVALGKESLPAVSQLADALGEGGAPPMTTLRMCLTDERRRWGKAPPSGDHEVWYLRGRKLLARWGPLAVQAPARRPEDEIDFPIAGIDPREFSPETMDAILAQLGEAMGDKATGDAEVVEVADASGGAGDHDRSEALPVALNVVRAPQDALPAPSRKTP